MATESKGRCRICGQPARQDHHPAGRTYLPKFEVPACAPDHVHQHVKLRRRGVPLAHDRMPSDVETVYAFIAGVSGVSEDAIANLGEGCDDDAQALDRLTSAILRDLLTMPGCDKRTFGPEPLAQAARRGPTSSRRVTIPPMRWRSTWRTLSASSPTACTSCPALRQWVTTCP